VTAPLTTAEMKRREQLARELAGDEPVDRILTAAKQQWLPRGGERSAADVVGVPIAGARLTAGTLLLALREAPLVIVVLIAVFLASETWQFFARLDGWEYAKVLAGLVIIMAVILVVGLREEARKASTIPEAELESHAAELEDPIAAAGFGPPPVGLRAPRQSRWTLRGTQVVRLTLLCAGVGLVAAAVFALMGATAVSPSLAGSWATRVGESPNYQVHELLNISLLGQHAETVTRELLLVCGAIGAIAALAFSVELVTGERLKEELLDRRFGGYRTAFLAWARLYHGEPPPAPTPAPPDPGPRSQARPPARS
jgi:hypothetical protein